MADEPAKVTPLFGSYVPSAGTSKVILERGQNALESLLERKMIAFGAVAIDEEGQPHMFFGHDPLQGTVLAGGLGYLQHHVYMELRKDMEDVTPPKGTTA
jgi:hypothetical protein